MSEGKQIVGFPNLQLPQSRFFFLCLARRTNLPLNLIFVAILLALIQCPAAAAGNESVIYYINEGCDYVEAGQYTKGIASFDRAIEHEPSFSLPWYNKGVTYQKMRRYHDALESYDQAVALDPFNTDALINRGIILRILGRYDEALESYQRALEVSPHSADIWNNMGVVYLDLDMIEEELRSFEMALSINPMLVAAWDNKGMALASQGRYDEALEAFEMALAIDPNDEVVRWHRDGAIQRRDLQEMAFRWVVIGSVVVVGYGGYRVWKRRFRSP